MLTLQRGGTGGRCHFWGVLVGCILWFAGSASAGVILTDLNSEVEFDLTSPAGMFRWEIDQVNQLSQQWFWYRIGPTGPERPVSSLNLDWSKASDGDLEPGEERLVAQYSGGGGGGAAFTIQFEFILTGGLPGSRASHMTEVIWINNLGPGRLDLHFFQYADFDLNNTAQDASVVITSGNTAYQTDPLLMISETVVTGPPSRYEVAYRPDILNRLNDGDEDKLANFAGPLTDGNLTWAFQWDLVLDPGRTFIISKGKNLVPEPAALALLAAGGALLASRRRRRA